MFEKCRLFSDVAGLAGGTLALIAGVRREARDTLRYRFETVLAEMDLVTRDEFDAAREMARTARAEQERLQARVEALEAAAKPLDPGPG